MRTSKNIYNIVWSQAVTHPSTNTTQCCLTSVIGRELVLSTWYGRRHWNWWKIDCVLKTIQVELSPTVCAGFLLTRNTLHKSHLVATFDNTSYTQKYKCRGSGFQSPKYWQKFKLVKNVLCHQNKQCVQYFELENVYSIVYSQAVTHPSTNTTRCCLTAVIGRELVAVDIRTV